jgi:hypothetical protein
MRSLASITRGQWTIIIVLELAGIALFCGVIPGLLLSTNSAPAIAMAVPTETVGAEMSATTPTRKINPTPTNRPAAATPTSTSTAAPTETGMPSAPPTPAPNLIAARMAPSAFVDWELNPRATLASKTTFFTSACFGEGANPLQDRDFMAPADWSGSPGRKCVFGYSVNPADGQPTGRYSVSGGADGQPHFYLVPPEAFAKDTQTIKTLSEIQIIVDPDQGCDALGSIGITADGQTYQSAACSFLRAGGVAPRADGSKSLVLPGNANNILDPNSNGGAYGFLSFPAIIFRKGFSLYFTGRAGYAPPRTWFEVSVDTLAPTVDVKTTAELTDPEVKEIAARFDRSLSGSDPKIQLAALEREAQVTSPAPVSVKSKQEGEISFAVTPGTVLSSVAWRVTPLNNVDKRQFLETNFCLDINGEESCFTGVEDFAHCAFYAPCITGYSRLDPIEHAGYIATRYFPAGTAPILRNGKVVAKFQAPDTGVVLEVDVKVRVRDVNATP